MVKLNVMVLVLVRTTDDPHTFLKYVYEIGALGMKPCFEKGNEIPSFSFRRSL